MTAQSRDLVRRVRALQERRHQLAEAKDHVGAHAALDLAVSLVDPCDLPTLREALLHATNPASVPRSAVVVGPQDVAAKVVGVDEVQALVAVYASAVAEWARRSLLSGGLPDADAEDLCRAAHTALMDAVRLLCGVVPPVELRGAPEGRTS